MKLFGSGYLILGVLLLVIITIIGLWSWNTLGGLFDLPSAQFKHAFAAAIGLLLVRLYLLPSRLSRYCHFHSDRREQ